MRLCWQPHSIIRDLELQPIKQRKTDHAAACLCMARNIVQRLLCDAVSCYLYSSGQRRKLFWCLHDYVKSCTGLRRLLSPTTGYAALRGILLDCRDHHDSPGIDVDDPLTWSHYLEVQARNGGRVVRQVEGDIPVTEFVSVPRKWA